MRPGRVVSVWTMWVGVGSAVPVQAQVAWESPMSVFPGAPAGFAVHVVDVPGGDVGVLGTYRISAAPGGVGYRVGLAEDGSEDLAVYGGIDVSGGLVDPTEEAPFTVIWFVGAGLSLSGDVLLSFPAGLAAGGEYETDGVVWRPFLAPRVVLDAFLRDGHDDLELDFAVDLGTDLSFSPTWFIRFAASVGDRDALLLGVGFPQS